MLIKNLNYNAFNNPSFASETVSMSNRSIIRDLDDKFRYFDKVMKKQVHKKCGDTCTIKAKYSDLEVEKKNKNEKFSVKRINNKPVRYLMRYDDLRNKKYYEFQVDGSDGYDAYEVKCQATNLMSVYSMNYDDLIKEYVPKILDITA